jgi:hypothetical protein
MTSNGPRWSRLSVHRRSRSIEAASIWSTPVSRKTLRNPSFSSAFIDRRSAERWFRTTCGPKSRSGRAALRSWQISGGTSKTTAIAKTWCSRASASSGARASRWTLVASITVSFPSFSRSDAIEWRTANAAPVAVWSFSSSDTKARQESEDTTSVAPKWRRGERRLPRTRHADQHDEAEVGDLDRGHRENTAIWVGEPTSGSSGPMGANSTE